MENKSNIKTNTTLFTGTSLAILSTTCCALPIALVSVGLGGAVASIFSNVPWLTTIAKYKVYTFSITALMLGYCWFALHSLGTKMSEEGAACNIQDQKILKWQKKILTFSSILLSISIFAAYALLPIRIWIENMGV